MRCEASLQVLRLSSDFPMSPYDGRVRASGWHGPDPLRKGPQWNHRGVWSASDGPKR